MSSSLQMCAPATVGGPPEPAGGGRPGTVLFVEDEPTLAILMGHLLARLKRPVIHAADGAVALQLFAEHRNEIALVIVDCHLPDMSGVELGQVLRRLVPGVPLLLTSGRDQRESLAAFAAGGPTEFMAKPYLPGEVGRRVNAFLAAL